MAVVFGPNFYPDANSKITADTYYIEDPTNITVTANPGYAIKEIYVELWFNATGSIKESFYEPKAVGLQTYTFTIRGKYKRTSGTKATAHIYARTEATGTVVTYEQNLNKVTSNFSSSSLKQTDVITFNTVGQSRFDGDIKVVFTRGGKQETVLFNKDTHPSLFDKGNKTFTLKLVDYWSDDLKSVSVTASAKDYVTYSDSLTNSTSNIKKSEVEQTDVLVLTADNGYSFQYLVGKDADIKVTKVVNGKSTTTTYNPQWDSKYFSNNNTVYTLSLSDIWEPGITSVSVYAKAFQLPMPANITVYQELVNVTSSLGAGDENGAVKNVPLNTVVTLTAKEGYVFEDGIQLVWTNQYGNQPAKRTYYPTAETDASYFNEEKTVFTVNLNEKASYDTISVSITAIAKQKYLGNDPIEGRTTAFANIYYADDSVLASVVSDRWLQTGSDYIDFGEYIYQVYKYPIKIDTSEFVSNETIPVKLGRHTGTTKSRYFLRSRIKFDLGKIAVPEEYKNVYDYRDVTCLLHLPYANPIEIDYTYVIGSGIQLFYLLDLYNGTTTLEVYSDKIEGGLVLRQDIDISYQIPFMKLAYNDVKGKIGRYLSNKVTTPYVEVIRPIPYDSETQQGKEGKEVGKLKDFNGYVEVRDVKLEGHITEQEREKIVNLLTNGVYINQQPKPAAP